MVYRAANNPPAHRVAGQAPELKPVGFIGLILIKASSPSTRRGTVAAPNNNLPAGERGGALMNFYTQQQRYYCGIDLHARSMYVCILDMKAIHGGKAKNDKIDAHKIAVLLRGGMLPMAYVYPAEMRATRDLLRRRCHLMRQRAELLTHIQNTTSQYNLPALGKKIASKANRVGVAERFPDPSVRASIAMDLALIDHYDALLTAVELSIVRTAKQHDANAFYRLRSVPGSGKILALVILYEIHDIRRFPRVQDFASYCRLVQCAQESAGKRLGSVGKKIGNAHLTWAFLRSGRALLAPEPGGPTLHGPPGSGASTARARR
jgi:hypothetical protein